MEDTTITQLFAEHTKNDEAFQDETRLIHAAQAESSAEMEGKLSSLEGKIDALMLSSKNIESFMKNVNIGEGIVRFSWNNMSKIGGVFTFIIGLYLFFKFGLAGLIALLFGGGLPK